MYNRVSIYNLNNVAVPVCVCEYERIVVNCVGDPKCGEFFAYLTISKKLGKGSMEREKRRGEERGA